MKCPYCGNDEPDKFLYPGDDDGPYVTCLACNGEFEQGETEYYEKQSGGEEEDMGPFPETSISLSDLPETLRWLRKMRKMTLKEVGEKSGLSISFLSDMERGRVRPSLETLQKLAIAYQTPLSIYLPSDSTVTEDFQEEVESSEDGLISLSTVIQLLDQEIRWSKENREQAPDNEADWFIKGLEQAKYLILEFSKLDPEGDLSSLEPKVNLPKGAPGYMGDYGGIPHGPFDL